MTSHIKNVIYSKNNSQPNQKNIQRRVYDAINVMCAAGLIRKNRQEIQFIRRTDQENHNHGANDETNSNEKKEDNDKLDSKDKRNYTTANREPIEYNNNNNYNYNNKSNRIY